MWIRKPIQIKCFIVQGTNIPSLETEHTLPSAAHRLNKAVDYVSVLVLMHPFQRSLFSIAFPPFYLSVSGEEYAEC